jgi:orotate phosphoribosyltransferase
MIRQEYFDRLKRMLLEHSVRTGDFVLASGKRSNVYVDCRLTTCRADAMPLIGRTMLERMRERGWQPYAVGGLTMGADPVVAAIARESLEYGMLIHSFLIRKEAKKHGRQQFLEGIAEPAGRDVVIIDDVCTTGGSTIMAIERARQAGMNVLGALCIVDREEGGREAIEQGQNCPFERVFTMKELLAGKDAA